MKKRFPQLASSSSNGNRDDSILSSTSAIDLCLDPFPCNGHTTSLDAFWMGVPTITMVGETVVGRAGLSQLSNLGLTELAAKTPDQYVALAVHLANDLPRLEELRSTLRERMSRSPLMDAGRFAPTWSTPIARCGGGGAKAQAPSSNERARFPGRAKPPSGEHDPPIRRSRANERRIQRR